MIRRDAWHIVHTDTGAAIWHSGGRWCWHHFDRPRIFTRAAAELLLADRPARWRDDPAALVRAPQCGCCGALTFDRSNHPLRPAVVAVASGLYRCGRHLGRLPCLIDGCGRTFAMDGGDYDRQVICGPHWRQAPRYMRDRVAHVRRIARRRGWTDDLLARHRRLWNRTVRAVRDGERLDMSEIDALFGWAA